MVSYIPERVYKMEKTMHKNKTCIEKRENDMKKPKLPDHPIKFEGHTPDSWVRVLRFDYPAKGEYYLSGAIVEAYQAPNTLPAITKYWIVEPIPQQPTPVLHES